LIAAGTVGLGGALGAIFAAGDVVNEDRKLRSIQGLLSWLDWYANNTAAIDSVITKRVLVKGGMMNDIYSEWIDGMTTLRWWRCVF
jgi:hypothetical protein